jgi:acyl-CoA synthetase (AMP-forming)/AMP-acid ligase II
MKSLLLPLLPQISSPELKVPCYQSETSNQVTTLIDILSDRAAYQPYQTAYTFLQNGEIEAAKLTYQELNQKARAIAFQLQKLGMTDERALLLYPPGLDFIAAFFGCLYAGVVAVPVCLPRRNQTLERLQTIVADAQAKVVLSTTAVLTQLERNLAQYPELAALSSITTDNLVTNLAQNWQAPALNPERLAFLQYTSGSTGIPKGVMVSHGNLLHNCALIHQAFGHSPKSQGVIWLPLYHDMGLIGGVLQPLYGGFPVTLMSPVDFLQKPLRWLETISQQQATTSGGPNFAYDLCVRKITEEQKAKLDLSSWEVAFTGAEPVRAETLETFAQAFKQCGFRKEAFYPCYGMAEATLFVTGVVKEQAPVLQPIEEEALTENRVVVAEVPAKGVRTLVGCGQPWSDMSVHIVNPDTLIECNPGEVGEIWIKGASVAQGYWNQRELTQQTFQAYLADTEEGPFLRTGDLGFVQPDGELFVTGRLKDVMIIRGRNHYPQDIELTVEESHAAVISHRSAAFSVDVAGEEKLVIVAEVERHYHHHWTPDKQDKETINKDTQHLLAAKELIGNIWQAVTTHHGLQVHAVWLLKFGSIPKTSSGKIQRYACRKGFLEHSLDVVFKSSS